MNAQEVLEELKRRGKISEADVMAVTGLSEEFKATVEIYWGI